MSVLNPEHLLDQALRLTAPRHGGGASRQADLRRAISNAYYGNFHAVATQAADDFVGKSQRLTPRYALVYRSISHNSLRRLCEDIEKENLPVKYASYEPRGGFGDSLKSFASAVLHLQEKRHEADYDPLFRVTRSDARAIVATGRGALAQFRKAAGPNRKAFVSLVVFSPRQS